MVVQPLFDRINGIIGGFESLDDFFRCPVLPIILGLWVRDVHKPLRSLVEIILLETNTHWQLETLVRLASFLQTRLQLCISSLVDDMSIRNHQSGSTGNQPSGRNSPAGYSHSDFGLQEYAEQ